MNVESIIGDFQQAVRDYAYNLVPSSAGIENRMYEHATHLSAIYFGRLSQSVYAAADALREYVDARRSMPDYAWEYGETTVVDELWEAADELESRMIQRIVCAFECPPACEEH